MNVDLLVQKYALHFKVPLAKRKKNINILKVIQIKSLHFYRFNLKLRNGINVKI